LLDSKKFQSHKKSKHHDILVNTLEVLHEIRRNGLKPSLDKLEPVRSDFHAHLEQNPSSEISTKLGKIYSFLNEYMRKLEAYAILQSSLYEECDKAELLGVDRKIEKLEDIRNQLSKTLRGESDMNLWAKKDRSYIERRIQRAKKTQEKLREWKQPVTAMDSTDPFIGYEHQVVVTVGNDQTNVLNTPVPNSILITMSINHNLEIAFWYLI
jgi:flagellin-specific chaperone FliS